MFCVSCGKQIPDNSKICMYCGKPIPESVRVSTETVKPEEVKAEEPKVEEAVKAEEIKTEESKIEEAVKAEEVKVEQPIVMTGNPMNAVANPAMQNQFQQAMQNQPVMGALDQQQSVPTQNVNSEKAKKEKTKKQKAPKEKVKKETAANAGSNPKKKGKGGLIAALIIVILLILGVGGSIFYLLNSTEHKLNQALKTNDVDAIVALYPSLSSDEKKIVQDQMFNYALSLYESYVDEDIEYEELEEVLNSLGKKVLRDDDEFEDLVDEAETLARTRHD